MHYHFWLISLLCHAFTCGTFRTWPFRPHGIWSICQSESSDARTCLEISAQWKMNEYGAHAPAPNRMAQMYAKHVSFLSLHKLTPQRDAKNFRCTFLIVNLLTIQCHVDPARDKRLANNQSLTHTPTTAVANSSFAHGAKFTHFSSRPNATRYIIN